MKLYIPWRIQLAAFRVYQYFRNALTQLHRPKKGALNISFYPDYQQATTGATIAISCIANQLGSQHNVDAYVKPNSGYSSLMNLNIRQTFNPDKLRGDIVFVDIEQENSTIEELLSKKRKVVLSCHALPTTLHAVPQPKLIRNLELATYIHFVSSAQQNEFITNYPSINIRQKSFVIHNYTRQSHKQNSTGDVGVVGYLTRPDKNALSSIQLAEKSNAKSIQCWGTDSIYGIDNLDTFPKIRINGWNPSLPEIHSSFDVLITTSKFESFGLVVAEALSAGIPCVLSDIPSLRSLYSSCKGVYMLSGDSNQDIAAINRLLEEAPILKEHIIKFWELNFSSERIQNLWFEQIMKISSSDNL